MTVAKHHRDIFSSICKQLLLCLKPRCHGTTLSNSSPQSQELLAAWYLGMPMQGYPDLLA